MKGLIRIALVAAGFASAAAVAGTELAKKGVALVPPDANTGAVAPSEQASTARETKKPGGQTLRCWQHGRLLFEGSGFKADAERKANSVTVQRADGESVVVYDNKDSMCILSNK